MRHVANEKRPAPLVARAGLELGGGLVRGPSKSPRGCEPSASTHGSAVSHQLGNRGGACTFYTALLSRESSTAGGRPVSLKISPFQGSPPPPPPGHQTFRGAPRERTTFAFFFLSAGQRPPGFHIQ